MTSFYFTKETCFLQTLVLKIDFKNTILLTDCFSVVFHTKILGVVTFPCAVYPDFSLFVSWLTRKASHHLFVILSMEKCGLNINRSPYTA